jgi:hypothetical protein
VQTCLERDLRWLAAHANLVNFRRFMRLASHDTALAMHLVGEAAARGEHRGAPVMRPFPVVS